MKRSPQRSKRRTHRLGRTTVVGVTIAAMVLGLPVSEIGGLAPAQAQPTGGGSAVAFAELSPETEAAITRGLAYLAREQDDDGGWGRPANTALALMAFMLKGHFPNRGPYGEVLDRGVKNLIRYGEMGGGYLGVNHNHGMYDHGLATLALAEVWGQSDHPELRSTLQRAVDVTLRAQHASGGWRYQPQPIDHDISVTIMQFMALISCHEAGILVPRQVIERAVDYVKTCQLESGGFAYRPGGSAVFARSAAGTLALHMGGLRGDRRAEAGLEYLWGLGDGVFNDTKHFLYGHYYAIQAMYQAGDQHYQRWYPKIRDSLLAKQRSDGKWNIRFGDDYSTAMAILILGVPYRYLPIYQR